MKNPNVSPELKTQYLRGAQIFFPDKFPLDTPYSIEATKLASDYNGIYHNKTMDSISKMEAMKKVEIE